MKVEVVQDLEQDLGNPTFTGQQHMLLTGNCTQDQGIANAFILIQWLVGDLIVYQTVV